MNEEKIKLTIPWHLEHPDITLEQHVKKNMLDLSRSLQGKKIVYLDTRFWLIARDASVGKRSDQASIDLLTSIQGAVDSGRAFCPISESTFAELMKQRDLGTRRRTAELIDRWSLGVSLLDLISRYRLELAHYIQCHLTQGPHPALTDLMWTKAAYTLGLVNPEQTPFAPEIELALQKAFFDHMWGITITEMSDTIGDAPIPDQSAFPKLAVDLNKLKRSPTYQSFKDAYLPELLAAVDMLAHEAGQFAANLLRSKGVWMGPHNAAAEAKYGELLKTLILAEIQWKPGNQNFPTAHINASLHASINWDRPRNFKENDFLDFTHASAGIGYCDVFLTENPLRHLATTKNIALDKVYDCQVISDIAQAVEAIRGL
jgi:hypothetical protein